MDTIKILKNNNEMNIITLNVKGDIYYRASDVGIILNITSIRSNIRDYDETEKSNHIIQTPGGPQNVTFLSMKGFKRVICKSRKQNAIELAKQLNINIYDSFYVPTEISFIKFIKETYKNEIIIEQFIVDTYRIDLYFPEYLIALECDEYSHIFQKEDDMIREKYITNKLGCIFIRFTQDKKMQNISKVINEINTVLKYKDKILQNDNTTVKHKHIKILQDNNFEIDKIKLEHDKLIKSKDSEIYSLKVKIDELKQLEITRLKLEIERLKSELEKEQEEN